MEHQDKLSYWEHHLANADAGLQYKRFSEQIENVQVIAQLHGIDDPEQIRRLQERAVDGPAGEAAAAGAHVHEVVRRFGIDDAQLAPPASE